MSHGRSQSELVHDCRYMCSFVGGTEMKGCKFQVGGWHDEEETGREKQSLPNYNLQL